MSRVCIVCVCYSFIYYLFISRCVSRWVDSPSFNDQWRIQNFIMGADGRGAECVRCGEGVSPSPPGAPPQTPPPVGPGEGLCPLPRKKNWIYTWNRCVLVHSRITFYVQKGIRKGVRDQQCRFCITHTSMQNSTLICYSISEHICRQLLQHQ